MLRTQRPSPRLANPSGLPITSSPTRLQPARKGHRENKVSQDRREKLDPLALPVYKARRVNKDHRARTAAQVLQELMERQAKRDQQDRKET